MLLLHVLCNDDDRVCIVCKLRWSQVEGASGRQNCSRHRRADLTESGLTHGCPMLATGCTQERQHYKERNSSHQLVSVCRLS